MRYLIALIGALIVFTGVLFLSGVLLAAVAPRLLLHLELGGTRTNNPGGVVLALVAATASFRATAQRDRTRRSSSAA